MLKKVLSLILSILLFLVVSFAEAEGFFPNISDLYGIELPSIESMTKANPIYSETLSDGSVAYVYDSIFDGPNYDISMESEPLRYWDKLLEKENCQLVNAEMKDGIYAAQISKDSESFYFFFDTYSQQVVCIYPKGTYPKRVPYSMDVIELGKYGNETINEITYNYGEPNEKTVKYSIPSTPKPVRWFVLKREGNEAYILSVRAFGRHQFSSSEDHNWDKSDIRTWINNDLYNSLFSEEEKKVIICKQYKTNIYDKADWDTRQVIDTIETNDNLVLLSLEEAKELPSKAERMLLTNYFISSIDYHRDVARYFLRTTTKSGNRGYVEYDGGAGLNLVSDCECQIRVAMWVNMEMIPPIGVNQELYSMAVAYYQTKTMQ